MALLHSTSWQQLPLGMQLVPHAFWPPGQTQAPDWHEPPSSVQSPAVQQFAWGIHWPAQSFEPPAHEQVPEPPQVPPSPQSAEVQQPAVAAQAPLQMPGMFAGHMHVPPWHVWPVTVVQSVFPQQLPCAMQAPLQSFWPLGHMHAPPWQVMPPSPQSVVVQQALLTMQAPLHAF
jgi:hypothetical protein